MQQINLYSALCTLYSLKLSQTGQLNDELNFYQTG